MRYYKYLYVQEGLEKKKDKIIKKLDKKKLQPNLHVITLASNPENNLDIISGKFLFQRSFSQEDLFVVGIVKSHDDALDYVESIIREVYDETGGTDIRSYILRKEQDS